MGCDIIMLVEDPVASAAGLRTWRLGWPPAFEDWSAMIRSPAMDAVEWELSLCSRYDDLQMPDWSGGQRVYKWFGFLAGIAVLPDAPCISPPRGLPADLSDAARTWMCVREWRHPRSAYGHSWLLASEILAFDYDQSCVPPGETRSCTVREYLDPGFFDWMTTRGVDVGHERRLVFFFDF